MTEGARLWRDRALLLGALLVLWQLGGTYVSDRWVSSPVAILARLVDWTGRDLFMHLRVTMTEIVAGLAIGLPMGILAGVSLGRLRNVAAVLRPFVVVLNSMPIVAMAPLLIMWFGIGMLPKIVLVAFVSFLLLFFNTFAGARAVDEEQLDALTLMGASGMERFRKVVLPACTAWIFAGLKNALPYALIAAVIGEMMVSRAGLGHLVARAGQQFDMTGIYAGLFVLMIVGSILNEAISLAERHLLRWRGNGKGT
jgi:NitT/TauT family transport system permease protein